MRPVGSSIERTNVAVIALFLLIPSLSAASPLEDFFPTIEFESVLIAGKPVPLGWVEVMIFAKNPTTAEFFERPVFDESWPRKFNPTTNRMEPGSKFQIKLNSSAFPNAKIWLLYRAGDRAEEPATFDSPDLRSLFDEVRPKAWLFEIPLSSLITKLSINADKLTYILNNPNTSRVVSGTGFPADYFPYKGRKGGELFRRLDRLSSAQEFLESLNRELSPALRLNLENPRIWNAEMEVHSARNQGPNNKDRLVMESGYTPIFIVVRSSSTDVDLPQDRPWLAAPKKSKKVIYTNLSQEDPGVWASLPPDVKTRYQNPSRIKAGTEVKLIAFWKPAESETDFPDIFFVYGRLPTGEEMRTAVFHRAPAAAR